MPNVIEQIAIRQWQDTNFDAAVTLNREAEEHIDMASETGDWAQDMEGVTGTFMGSGGDFLLGFQGEQLVVMGGYKRLSETVAEVKRMRVTPELQGKGIGYWFLDLLEGRMVEAGITDAEVSTTSEQEGAIHLYKGAGYTEVGRFEETREHDHGLIIVSFKKTLA